MVKMCPMTFGAYGAPGKFITGRGVPRDCQGGSCMWWMDGECAITILARSIKKP